MKPILFISDLHLDPSRPGITRLFLNFLATRAREASALYILGDLFEAWIGDDDPEPEHRLVIEHMRSLVDRGTPVYLLHGNRDFLIGHTFAERSGCTLLPDPSHIELFGTPAIIMHGDTLCTDDTDYQQFRDMVRDPVWQQDFLHKPISERQAIARQLRETSRERTRHKAEYITDVNTDAVADAMRDAAVLLLIHGHTHRPAIHDFTLDHHPAQRIVLGDWYEQGSVLVCNRQGCRLEILSIQQAGGRDTASDQGSR